MTTLGKKGRIAAMAEFSVLLAAVVGSPVAWLLGSSAVFVQPTAGWNMYQSDTSLVVPYISGESELQEPRRHVFQSVRPLSMQVAGQSVGVTIDTGSTGIAISQSYLPSGALNGLTPIGPGAINYDSSGNTPTGTFYQLPVSILAAR